MKTSKESRLKIFVFVFFAFSLFICEVLKPFYSSYEGFFSFFFQRKPQKEEKIVIVAIDEKSQDIFGNWPWDKSLQANLLENILELSPSSVGYDIILTDNIKDEGTERITSHFTSEVQYI
ncbi:MAG: hypothetical protein Fur009_3490 [Candidatus Microgenomates bacterium]